MAKTYTDAETRHVLSTYGENPTRDTVDAMERTPLGIRLMR